MDDREFMFCLEVSLNKNLAFQNILVAASGKINWLKLAKKNNNIIDKNIENYLTLWAKIYKSFSGVFSITEYTFLVASKID